MKASEALKASSIGVFRDAKTGAVAYDNGMELCLLAGDTREFRVENIPGDDWQPLVAVSPVSDERVRELEEKHRERVGRLRADIQQRAEWLSECIEALDLKTAGHFVGEAPALVRQNLAEKEDLLEKQGRMITDYNAELSTLRAQLEGQWELGEPLTAEQIKGMRNEWVIIDKKGSWEVTRAYLINGRYLEGESTSRLNPNYGYYRWTPPTLPSEPEPEVPAPEKRKTFYAELVDLLNSHSAENNSNTPDYVLADFLTKVLSAWDDAIGARAKHAGIEPTQELLEALEGE